MNDSNSTAIRFCPKCQCDTDRYKDGHCKPCARKTAKLWSSKNKDKVKENNAAWNARNADYVREAKAKLYKKNQQLNISRAAEYYRLHREKALEYANIKRSENVVFAIARCREWRAKNPEKANESTRSWQIRNKDKVSVYKENRRAKKSNANGKLSSELKGRLFKLQRGKCACCGLPLGDNYHLDHIMPLALGGSNTDDNIQLLRQRCNNQKHAKHPVDFMQERGFLL